MSGAATVRKAWRGLRSGWFRLRHAGEPAFHCPVCGYRGPFRAVRPDTGLRRHAQCPSCQALERHRLQYLVLQRLFADRDLSGLKMLHVAPEPFFREFFASRVSVYETADISMPGVDHRIDLQSLPFAAGSYDLVFASHVMEHVRNDQQALAEIRRILRPGGIAILPVPLVAPYTIEYPEPNPHEAYHVRAPGHDYFQRYEQHFARVELFSSESLPAGHQLFIYEDRSRWPTRECPLRPAMAGERHADVVPVCYA